MILKQKLIPIIRKTCACLSRTAIACLDLLYPDLCLLCGAVVSGTPGFRVPVCRPCLSRLRPITGRRCTVCGVALISEAETCTRCRQLSFAFSAHRAVFMYQGPIRELLFYYKFKSRRRLGPLFAGLLPKPGPAERIDFIIPVSSGLRSLRQRGFNHVLRLARLLSRLWGVPVLDCLGRKRGKAQKSLNLAERMANIQGLFFIKKGLTRCAGKSAFLLDDIFTTGATAHECAGVLKRHGVRTVYVGTIAMD